MAKNLKTSVVMNNGLSIPILGLGTWGSPPGEVTQAVKEAIDVGYRHIDCAYVYGNEVEVGLGVAEKIKEGTIKREDLFITSKLWNTFHRPDLVRGACKATLKNLGMSYLDLYLIHWPMAYKEDGDLFPKDAAGNIIYSDVNYVDTWKEMEKLVADGLVKSIGVSNFNKRQIENILKVCQIAPVNNQVECHPYLNQTKLMEFCKSKNITLTAYSPLGSPNRPWAKPGNPVLLEDPRLVAFATKYNKAPAQILIRYQIQRGNICIPKSVTKKRIADNFSVFDFELSKDDITTIDTFNVNERFVAIESIQAHKNYPFIDAY